MAFVCASHYIYIYMYVCMYVSMYVCMYVSMYVVSAVYGCWFVFMALVGSALNRVCRVDNDACPFQYLLTEECSKSET